MMMNDDVLFFRDFFDKDVITALRYYFTKHRVPIHVENALSKSTKITT